MVTVVMMFRTAFCWAGMAQCRGQSTDTCLQDAQGIIQCSCTCQTTGLHHSDKRDKCGTKLGMNAFYCGRPSYHKTSEGRCDSLSSFKSILKELLSAMFKWTEKSSSSPPETPPPRAVFCKYILLLIPFFYC